MTSQDDLALLKGMHQRGEITDAQYDVLRRHVLWGTPLPQPSDDVPAPRAAADPADGYVPGAATVGPDRYPEVGAARHTSGRYAGEPGGGWHPMGAGESAGPPARRYTSRRERREAEEAGQAPPTYLPPATAPPPPAGTRRSRHRRADRTDDTFPPPTPPGPTSDSATTPPAARHWPEPDRAAAPPVSRDAPRHRPSADRADAPPVGADRPARRWPEPDRADAPPVTRDAPRHWHRPDPDAELESGELVTRRGRRPGEDGPPTGGTGGRPREEDGARRPHRRSVFAVLASVVLALALAAGGVYWFVLRTNGPPPAAYAREACGVVHDWQQSVDSSNATLINQISRQQDKTTVRSDVTTYYTTIAGRTDQLRTAILGLGAADITGGREYADSLAAAVGDQAAGLRRLADRAGRLDPAAPAFTTDLQTVLTGADAAVSAVTAALARPAAGVTTELRTTLSNEPACVPYVG